MQASQLPSMDLNDPPTFQSVQDELPPTPDPNSELPSYSRNVQTNWDVPPLQTNHIYHLTKKRGFQWLTLALTSRARSSEDTPLFFQGGQIAATLQLDLEKEEIVESVSASVSSIAVSATESPSSYLMRMCRLACVVP